MSISLRCNTPIVTTILAVLTPSMLFAETISTDATTVEAVSNQLPAVTVVADDNAESNYTANKSQVSKSATTLSQTPQSITVVPRAVLDSQQAVSLPDALENVPGVVSNQYGRRGWDDLIIRGQVASNSLYLDG